MIYFCKWDLNNDEEEESFEIILLLPTVFNILSFSISTWIMEDWGKMVLSPHNFVTWEDVINLCCRSRKKSLAFIFKLNVSCADSVDVANSSRILQLPRSQATSRLNFSSSQRHKESLENHSTDQRHPWHYLHSIQGFLFWGPWEACSFHPDTPLCIVVAVPYLIYQLKV